MKLKPIKWLEACNHEDLTEWSMTHGVLHCIYWRDVEQRKFLEPSDFLMNLFSHAVTGTTEDMTRARFQEMMGNGQVDDLLGLLKYMDEISRDQNEEQTAALLFYAYKQFSDKSLSSFLQQFQQLLVRSPNSSEVDKNKIYDLLNTLNQTMQN